MVAVFDYLQIDIPDEDYTYSQVEALRENDNVNRLFRFPYQMDQYGVQIGDFNTLAGTSFGLGYVTVSFATSQFARTDILYPYLSSEIPTILSTLSRIDTIGLTLAEVAELLWLTLEAYRWRNDDGSEVTATWAALQDTQLTRNTTELVRLRVLMDTSSDSDSFQFRLQYRPVGDPDWEWRDVP